MNGKIIEADYTINGKISSADSTLKGQVNKLYELRGYSAYEVAVLEGFEGTEEEWLASLKGEQGEKGDKGDKGEKGEKGEKGDSGTGTGDMLAGVYDPQGKKKDIFAEISKAALSDLSNVSNDVMKAKVEASGFVSGGGDGAPEIQISSEQPTSEDISLWIDTDDETVESYYTKDEVDDKLAARALEDADHPGCYYRIVSGAKEWLNPPMLLGVECRTTERYLGKPVYAKAVACGALVNGTFKSTAHGIENYDAFLSVTGYAYASSATDRIGLPLVNGNLSSAVFVSVASGSIKTSCIGDWSSWPNHTVILKYTKTTD